MVNLSGVWNLVSFNLLLPNGTSVAQPNGPRPLGKIAIMSEGYLSVQITTPEAAVPIPDGVAWGDATDEQIAMIARPYVGYSGRYVLEEVGDERQLQLVTTVDVSLNPSWMVDRQRRNVTMIREEGKEYMLLKPVGLLPFKLPGNITDKVTSVLKWEREIAAC